MGRHVGQHPHHLEGIHPPESLVLIGVPSGKCGFKASDPRSDDHPRPFRIGHLVAQFGIGHGLHRGRDR